MMTKETPSEEKRAVIKEEKKEWNKVVVQVVQRVFLSLKLTRVTVYIIIV